MFDLVHDFVSTREVDVRSERRRQLADLYDLNPAAFSSREALLAALEGKSPAMVADLPRLPAPRTPSSTADAAATFQTWLGTLGKLQGRLSIRHNAMRGLSPRCSAAGIHEAGHAVVSLYGGLPIVSLGRNALIHSPVNPDSPAPLDLHAKIGAAGLVAELFAFGRLSAETEAAFDHPEGDVQGLRNTARLIRMNHPTHPPADPFEAAAKEFADPDTWAATVALASALDREGTMGPDRVKAVVRSAYLKG